LKLPVLTLSPDVDESTPADWSPQRVVEQLALRKASAVMELLQIDADRDTGEAASSLIIGADTIVVLEHEIMGKPRDPGDAFSMLQRLQGKTHEVYTGVAVIRTEDGRTAVAHRRTKVTMKPLDSKRIERYVSSGEPLDKAGSYGIQGLGAVLVESVEGCYFNVVGLPLSLLADMLSEFGVEVV
jgi:septum formation protein